MAQFTHSLCEEVIRTDGKCGLTRNEMVQMARLALRTLDPDGPIAAEQREVIAKISALPEAPRKGETSRTDAFSNPSTEGDEGLFVSVETYNALLESHGQLERELAEANEQIEIQGFRKTTRSPLRQSGMELAMRDAPTTQHAIMRVMRDHYWDSLEPQKELVLKHIEGAMRLLHSVPSPRGQLGCPNYLPGMNDSCERCGEARFSHSNQSPPQSSGKE
jgi:hypothetical protein